MLFRSFPSHDTTRCNVFVSAGENMQVQVLDDAGYGGLQIYPPPLEIGNLVEQSGDAGADVIDDVHERSRASSCCASNGYATFQ